MSIIFEFFSGVGGFHQVLSSLNTTYNNLKIKKILPFDVNLNANSVYCHNFQISPFTNTLERLKLQEYNRLCENNLDKNSNIIWFMSPPCQPFTSLGNQLDLNDDRSAGFRNLIENILSNTRYPPEYLLLENYSNAWSILLNSLKSRKFSFKQFIISPHQFGIPNRRIRYYLLARGPNSNSFPVGDNAGDDIITSEEFFSKTITENETNYHFIMIKDFLKIEHSLEHDLTMNKKFYLKENQFYDEYNTYGNICDLSSVNTNCFTKGYGKLLKGSGSVLYFGENFENREILNLQGKVRFFTPEEIMKFMCFIPSFKFPNEFSNISKYKLLGNSINVKVVRILLKYLLNLY